MRKEDAKHRWALEEGPKQEEAEQAGRWQRKRSMLRRGNDCGRTSPGLCESLVGGHRSPGERVWGRFRFAAGKERSQFGMGRVREKAGNPGLE